MSERTRPRVARLLGIVAYLEDNGPTPFADLAEHFDITVAQVRKDIDQLWLVGRPGGFAHDLIDFDADAFDSDVANITNTQGASQVRLAPREGVALVAALSAMVNGGAAPRAAETALAKITAALGEDTVTVSSRQVSSTDVAATLAAAIAQKVVVELDYVDAADRRTARAVEPHRIVTIDGGPYLECYCRRAGDYRTLRIDRIGAAVVTEHAVVTAASDLRGLQLPRIYEATVRMRRAGRWAVEDIPGVEIVDDGEAVTVVVGVTSDAWLAGRLLNVAPSLLSVDPPQLRDEMARQAHSVLLAHGE